MNLSEKISQHKPTALKVALAAVAIIILVLAFISFTNSEHIKDQQTTAEQNSLENHTQILNEIQKAVNELKSNNATDHATTIKYINCVLVGITEAQGQAGALSVYQTCLANSDLPITSPQ